MRCPNIALTILLLVLLCMPAGAGAMSGSEDATGIYHPTVISVDGVVSVKGQKYKAWEEAREGMLLLSGDMLRTGRDSHARIRFPSGELEIYETTVVVIPNIDIRERKKDIREVFVEEGKTLFNINPLGVEKGFEFRTRNIQGGVKGTIFSVSYLEGGTSVNVYRGEVMVSGLEMSEGREIKLKAGRSARIKGRADSAKIKNFDPSSALEDYRYNIPPGLNKEGLPADSKASAENKGIRKRGKKSTVSTVDEGDSISVDSIANDQGEDEK